MEFGINDKNKERVALVVVGYNRLKSMERLLASLSDAHYPENDIPLIISIDKSGCTELYQYVDDFNWSHGEKLVIIQEERLGLKRHIYKCADLTRYFKAIILLEDDLYVSPYFYDYACHAVDFYRDDPKIAGISLYKNERNGYVGMPLSYLQDGSDSFAMQAVSTWGECWTEPMWADFCEWQRKHEQVNFSEYEIPVQMVHWQQAWSKYYNIYMIETGKYFIYPHIALSTNFNDAGVHGRDSSSAVQVHLLEGPKSYCFRALEQLVKYDIFGNNEMLYSVIGLESSQLCLDLGGNREPRGRRFILSVRRLPFAVIRSFGLKLRPIELNVIKNIEGEGIYLYDTSVKHKKAKEDYLLTAYYLKGFRPRLLWGYIWSVVKQKLRTRTGRYV